MVSFYFFMVEYSILSTQSQSVGTNLSLQKHQLFCFVISETTSVPLKARPGKGGRERWRLSVPGKERRGETCYQRENRGRGRICPQTWSRSSSHFLSSCSNPEWKPLVRFLFQARNKKGPLNSPRQKYELLQDFPRRIYLPSLKSP